MKYIIGIFSACLVVSSLTVVDTEETTTSCSMCPHETATIGPGASGGSFTYGWSNSSTGATLTTGSAGTYVVTVTESSGCTTTEDFIITALPAGNVSVTFTSDIGRINCGSTQGSYSVAFGYDIPNCGACCEGFTLALDWDIELWNEDTNTFITEESGSWFDDNLECGDSDVNERLFSFNKDSLCRWRQDFVWYEGEDIRVDYEFTNVRILDIEGSCNFTSSSTASFSGTGIEPSIFSTCCPTLCIDGTISQSGSQPNNGWDNQQSPCVNCMSGDQEICFEVVSISPSFWTMFGINDNCSNSTGYQDIDCAFSIQSFGAGNDLFIYENGVSQGPGFTGSYGSVAVGDELCMRLVGGTLTYRQNGSFLDSKSGVSSSCWYLDDSSQGGGFLTGSFVIEAEQCEL